MGIGHSFFFPHLHLTASGRRKPAAACWDRSRALALGGVCPGTTSYVTRRHTWSHAPCSLVWYGFVFSFPLRVPLENDPIDRALLLWVVLKKQSTGSEQGSLRASLFGHACMDRDAADRLV